jgi:hypothetical protein
VHAVGFRASTTTSDAHPAAGCRTSTSQGCSRRLDRANAKSLVTSPVHSLRPCWKVIEHSETASKYFSNLLRFEDEPVARSRLPRGVGQPVAVPTPPEVATRSIELSDPSTTVTQKVSSSSAEVPWHPSDWEYLIVERDSIVVPVPWLNASIVKFISVARPKARVIWPTAVCPIVRVNVA